MQDFEFWTAMNFKVRLFCRLYTLQTRIIFPDMDKEKNRLYIRDESLYKYYLFIIKNSEEIKVNYEN